MDLLYETVYARVSLKKIQFLFVIGKHRPVCIGQIGVVLSAQRRLSGQVEVNAMHYQAPPM